MFGGTLAVLSLAMRPSKALADHCGDFVPKVCPSGPNGGPGHEEPHFCCPQDALCCDNPDGVPHCCCSTQACTGGKCIGPCCKEGEAPCGNYCCDAGNICADAQLGICCVNVPGLDYECGSSSPECRRRVRKKFDRAMDRCIAERRSAEKRRPSGWSRGEILDAASAEYMRCTANALSDSKEQFEECPQRPDDAFCPQEGTCATDTLHCCYGEKGGHSLAATRGLLPRASSQPPATTSPAPVETFGPSPDGAPMASASSAVSKAELRQRLTRAGPRLDRAFRNFDAAQSAYTDTGAAASRLARACDSYRREILGLRRKLAVGRGGRPQRLLLATYDEVAHALLAYRGGILYETQESGQRSRAASLQRWRRARRLGAKARRALG